MKKFEFNWMHAGTYQKYNIVEKALLVIKKLFQMSLFINPQAFLQRAHKASILTSASCSDIFLHKRDCKGGL